MSAHTPAPWTQWGDVIGSLGHHVIAQMVAPTERTGDIQPLSLIDPKFDEQMANARLIAAAPELLEALKDARHQVCSMLCPSFWRTGEPQPHGEKCRAIAALIAKAEQKGC